MFTTVLSESLTFTFLEESKRVFIYLRSFLPFTRGRSLCCCNFFFGFFFRANKSGRSKWEKVHVPEIRARGDTRLYLARRVDRESEEISLIKTESDEGGSEARARSAYFNSGEKLSFPLSSPFCFIFFQFKRGKQTRPCFRTFFCSLVASNDRSEKCVMGVKICF